MVFDIEGGTLDELAHIFKTSDEFSENSEDYAFETLPEDSAVMNYEEIDVLKSTMVPVTESSLVHFRRLF